MKSGRNKYNTLNTSLESPCYRSGKSVAKTPFFYPRGGLRLPLSRVTQAARGPRWPPPPRTCPSLVGRALAHLAPASARPPGTGRPTSDELSLRVAGLHRTRERAQLPSWGGSPLPLGQAGARLEMTLSWPSKNAGRETVKSRPGDSRLWRVCSLPSGHQAQHLRGSGLGVGCCGSEQKASKAKG